MRMLVAAYVVVFLPLTCPSVAFQFLTLVKATRRSGREAAVLRSFASSDDYLSSLSKLIGAGTPTVEVGNFLTAPADIVDDRGHREDGAASAASFFSHAPLSHFAIEKLTPKGPRKNADVGRPHDASLPLAKVGPTSAGSWWCAEGGWPSPTPRATTEVFFVLSGRGCLTDVDGTRHHFGPGDTVVLPKGWSGRWDVVEDIHKVWVVHDHPNVEGGGSNPMIRAVVTPYSDFAKHKLGPGGVRPDATHGSPRTASNTIYDVGPVRVRRWRCTPGSFLIVDTRSTTECFHVLEGVFFLTNSDGGARRCVAGDTVILPGDWTGHWDVIETVKKLSVVME